MSGSNGNVTEMDRLKAFGTDRVTKTVGRFGSVRKAAALLTVSHTALRRFLIQAGVEYGSLLRRPTQKGTRQKRGSLVQWVRKNPGVVLPRNVPAIIELTGCTKDQVCTYLYRQRKRARALIAKLPDLRTVKLGVQLDNGEALDLRQAASYEVQLDHYSAKARLRLTMPDGVVFHAKVPNLERFVEMTNQYVESTSGRAS